MRSITSRITPVLAVSFALGACGGGSSNFEPPPDPDPPPPDDPPAIGVQQVFTSIAFNQPLAMLQAPGDDSQWFVVERRGRIAMFPNVADPAAGDIETFADLATTVNSNPGEGGLLGMAFHPEFATNDEVFLSYTRGSLESVVSRFTVDVSTGAAYSLMHVRDAKPFRNIDALARSESRGLGSNAITAPPGPTASAINAV
jgi:glucose/arabinose dehydrogenase